MPGRHITDCADTGPGIGHTRMSMAVDLFVFAAAPQPLDKDVVDAAALAVHADRDAVTHRPAGEVVTRRRRSTSRDAQRITKPLHCHCGVSRWILRSVPLGALNLRE